MEQEQTPVSQEPSTAPVSNANKNKTLLVVVVVLVVLALGYMVSSRFTGERMVERAMERASGGNVDFDMNTDGEGTVRIKGEDGAEIEYSAGGNVALPDAWPGDVPVMDGASITYAGSVNPESGQAGVMIVLMTDKSPTVVTEYYTTELTDAGWTIVSTVAMGEASMLGISKDAREGSVYATGGPDGTSVTISITE